MQNNAARAALLGTRFYDYGIYFNIRCVMRRVYDTRIGIRRHACGIYGIIPPPEVLPEVYARRACVMKRRVVRWIIPGMMVFAIAGIIAYVMLPKYLNTPEMPPASSSQQTQQQKPNTQTDASAAADKTQSHSQSSSRASSQQSSSRPDFDGAKQRETGEGLVYLRTPGGDYYPGQKKVPSFGLTPHEPQTMVELATEAVNDKHKTFVFVDGKKLTTIQSISNSETLTLTDSALRTAAEHKIEVVQFSDDNHASGKVIFYRLCKYRIE